MPDGRLPGATWADNPRSLGGTYHDGYPWRITLHTIEGGVGANPWTHPYSPHLWYDPATRALWQCIPLTRSAFALYQGSGPPTNKARALQVEIAGYAATAGGWPDEHLANLAADVIVPLCRWVEGQGGRIDLDHVPPIGTIGGSASEHAPQRLSYDAWSALDGLCSHRHVPDNDHWDTGTLNIPRVVELAKELLGTTAPAAKPPPNSRRRRRLAVPLSTLRPESKPGRYIHDLFVPRKGDRVIARLVDPANASARPVVTVHWGSGLGSVYEGHLGDTGNGRPFDAEVGVPGLCDRWAAGAVGLCSVICAHEVILELDPAD